MADDPEYKALKAKYEKLEKTLNEHEVWLKAACAEIRASIERIGRVADAMIKAYSVPRQQRILVNLSVRLLLTTNPKAPRGYRCTSRPIRIGPLDTPLDRDEEREIESLISTIKAACLNLEPEDPREIVNQLLSLRRRFGVLGLEKESDVIWLGHEVCWLP